jgi:hypothetical protein
MKTTPQQGTCDLADAPGYSKQLEGYEHATQHMPCYNKFVVATTT